MQKILLGVKKFAPLAKLAMLLFVGVFASNFAMAQQRTVTGKVISGEDQQPLPGVNILVKGTSNGVISDVNGDYKVNLGENDDLLVFSFVGFLTQEVSLSGRTSLNVTLASDAKQLSEVVVTAFGIEKDAAKLGYTTQKVQGSDLVKAREPNALNSLVGKVAGLTVGASSELLGAPQLVLRGESDVLLVIDGVPVISDTWNISPDDIESYTVLKGPNAAALYGSRGRNGAIIMTTKRASSKNGGIQIDFNSSTMMDKGFLTIPKVQDDYGPGEYNTYRFGDDAFGQSGGYNQNDYDIWGPKFNGQLISQYDSPVDPNSGIRTGTPWVARGKNNLQRFLQAGILSTNNISISSSNEKFDIRASISNSYQRGVVPSTELNITSINVTTGVNFSKKLRFESNINYNRQYTDNFPDVNYGPNSIIYNIDIWGGSDWDIDQLKDYWQPGKVGIQQLNYEYYRYNNPWFLAKEWKRGHYKNDIYGYLKFNYKITNWLEVTGRTQLSAWDLFRNEKFPYSATVYGREQRQGDYREDRRNLIDNNTDVTFTINKDVTPTINISGLVGGNLRTYGYHSFYGTTDYLNTPGVYNFANSKNTAKLYNYDANMQIASGFYSFDFGFKKIANISTTGRWDKFSTFNEGYNVGFYPSVSVSSVINDYVQLPEVLSFLKVRASYANVKDAFTTATIGPAWQASGNGNPIGYGSTYQSVYGGPNYYSNAYSIDKPYNNQTGATYTSTLAPNNLVPSANSSTEVGIDAKFLENKLSFGATYFEAIKGPGIIVQSASEASGFSGGYINGGKTKKTGFEFTLSGTPIKNENFSWNVMTNWSTFKEVYNEFAGGVDSLSSGAGYYLKKGARVDNVWGYKFFRDQSGNIIHKDGQIYNTDRKRQLLGHGNADWVWSVVNTFTYKNWAFNFQVDGRIGGVGVDYVYKKLLQGGRADETATGAYGDARLAEFNANPTNDPNKDPLASYVGSGVTLVSGTPKLDYNGNIINYNELKFATNSTPYALQDYINREVGFDERVLISSSFAKLRQVTITYTLPSDMLKRLGFSKASISLVGRNLLYFASRTDIDLDQFVGKNLNSQILQTPTLRRYGVNINLTF